MIPCVKTDHTTKMQKLRYKSSQSFICVNQDTQFWFNVIILHLFIRGEMSLWNRFVDTYKKWFWFCICSFSLFLINWFNCLSYGTYFVVIIQAFVEYMHKIKFEWKYLTSFQHILHVTRHSQVEFSVFIHRSVLQGFLPNIHNKMQLHACR